jgi:hypothetical protein
MNGSNSRGTWRPEETEGRGEALGRKHRKQGELRREYGHMKRGGGESQQRRTKQ